jgi:hypothetical protein
MSATIRTNPAAQSGGPIDDPDKVSKIALEKEVKA